MTVKQRRPSGLLLPVRFFPRVEGIGDAMCVGDWLIGYESDPEQPYSLSLPESVLGQQQWLEAHFRDLLGEKSPDAVRRFVLRYGTFRERDWQQVEKALRGKLPAKVKEEIRHSMTGTVPAHGGPQVYLLQLKDFWNEWHLLQALAELTGKLAGGDSPLKCKHEMDIASRFLSALRPPAKPGFINGVPLDEFELGPEGTLIRRARPRTPEQIVHRELNALLGHLSTLALGGPKFVLHWTPDTPPGFEIALGDVRAVAYACLLGNSSTQWRRCKRPGCGNLFVYRGRRKEYCEWYCAHLHGTQLRRQAKKEAALKRKRRQQSKSKGGKR